jgi:hypothetical protein
MKLLHRAQSQVSQSGRYLGTRSKVIITLFIDKSTVTEISLSNYRMTIRIMRIIMTDEVTIDIVREGPCSQGASWAVCGRDNYDARSGVLGRQASRDRRWPTDELLPRDLVGPVLEHAH